MKICSKCKKAKPLTDFHRERNSKDDRRSHCKECRRKYQRDHFKVYAGISRRHYIRNREMVIERSRIYRQLHKKELYVKQKLYNAKRKREGTDRKQRLAQNLHTYIYRALRGDVSNKAVELMGCSVEKLRRHIESMFQPGMSWANHNKAGWHIDHIKPKISYDLNDPIQQRECFNYKNTQPLWAVDNKRKGNRYVA